MGLPGALKSWGVRPVSQNTLGMVLFSLEADCEGGRVKQILQAEVWKTVEVAKLRRLAKRGEMLRETDLERASVRVKSQSADNVIPFEEAVGRPLATFKSAGTVIRASDILSCDVSDGDSLITRAISEPATNNKMPDYALPAINTVRRTEGARLARPGVKPVMQQTGREAWVVKPGDQVQFGVQVNGLSLTVPARAVEGGAVGDSIRLVNMQNQRSISGKIVAPGKVEHAED